MIGNVLGGASLYPCRVKMDRSGVLIVVVGCMFLAAGGALIMLKSARQNAEIQAESGDHSAPLPPNEISPAVQPIPTIEPIPTVAPPVVAAQNTPDDPAENAKRLATGSGSATTANGEGDKAVVAGDVGSPQTVISHMGPDFRRCYNNGLTTNPNMKGSLRVTARIGPDGKVVVANASGGNGLSQEVIACVTKRVKIAQFAPPEGGGATIVVPVSFVAQ